MKSADFTDESQERGPGERSELEPLEGYNVGAHARVYQNSALIPS
jgi:hypothetical protein